MSEYWFSKIFNFIRSGQLKRHLNVARIRVAADEPRLPVRQPPTLHCYSMPHSMKSYASQLSTIARVYLLSPKRDALRHFGSGRCRIYSVIFTSRECIFLFNMTIAWCCCGAYWFALEFVTYIKSNGKSYVGAMGYLYGYSRQYTGIYYRNPWTIVLTILGISGRSGQHHKKSCTGKLTLSVVNWQSKWAPWPCNVDMCSTDTFLYGTYTVIASIAKKLVAPSNRVSDSPSTQVVDVDESNWVSLSHTI